MYPLILLTCSARPAVAFSPGGAASCAARGKRAMTLPLQLVLEEETPQPLPLAEEMRLASTT